MSFSFSNRIRIFLFVFLLTTFLFAQKSDSGKTKPFQFPKKSLQFAIDNNFTIRSFQGALISAKYHFSNQTAFRIGISVSGHAYGEDYSKNVTNNDSMVIATDDERQYLYLMIHSQFLHYFNPDDDIKLYAGLGPYFSANIDLFKTGKVEVADNYHYTPPRKRNTTSLQSGISTVYGVEWFFRKNMSLLAEYGFVFYYFYYESKKAYSIHDNRTEEIKKRNGWSLINRFHFGVSVYF